MVDKKFSSLPVDDQSRGNRFQPEWVCLIFSASALTIIKYHFTRDLHVSIKVCYSLDFNIANFLCIYCARQTDSNQ